MSNDPETVLDFAERARKGGWGEASVLADRYVQIVREIERLAVEAAESADESERQAEGCNFALNRGFHQGSSDTARAYAKELRRILRGEAK